MKQISPFDGRPYVIEKIRYREPPTNPVVKFLRELPIRKSSTEEAVTAKQASRRIDVTLRPKTSCVRANKTAIPGGLCSQRSV